MNKTNTEMVLEPCPFCGGEASLHSTVTRINCLSCPAVMGGVQGKKLLIESWNKKASQPSQTQYVQESGIHYSPITEELDVAVLPDEDGMYEHRFKLDDRLSQQTELFIVSGESKPQEKVVSEPVYFIELRTKHLYEKLDKENVDDMRKYHPVLTLYTAPQQGKLDNGALKDAYEIGRTGVPHSDTERELFCEYMRGHCWQCGVWDAEKNEYVDHQTRIMYAVFRARGAIDSTKVVTN